MPDDDASLSPVNPDQTVAERRVAQTSVPQQLQLARDALLFAPDPADAIAS